MNWVDGAGGVVFAGVAGALQIAQDLLVDVVEEVAILPAVKVDLVDAVDDLAHEGARFHVVVGVGEDFLDDIAARIAARFKGHLFQRREELIVDKVEQFASGDPLIIRRPSAPAQPLGNGRDITFFPFIILLIGVKHLQKKHPHKLRDTLCISVDASVLAMMSWMDLMVVDIVM